MLIQQLLPSTVAAAEAHGEEFSDAFLLPEERPFIARAVASRRREFTAVRACARTAMAQLGYPPAPLLPGERGAPGWPDGLVGSMTHCAGYRAAAVARAGAIATIGIDAEPHQPLPRDVLAAIALPEETEHLAQLTASHRQIHASRLLFSAKESVYKAWFPLAREFLDFSQASITLDVGVTGSGWEGTFTAVLLVPGPTLAGRPLTGFHGRWRVSAGLVITAIALPVPAVAVERRSSVTSRHGLAGC